ncbi:MAG: PE family protein [Mycobacterium sp.]|uniref:PE family protein n=1 Tax=Mycobacterium sp. TaxID=1785 RepID=UPI003C502A66
MSFVNAVPEAVTAAAGDLAGIGSALAAANAAATPTAGIEALAADAVSAALVAVFSSHGLGYQSLGAELTELHDQIVQALRSSARSYTAAESENASLLQEALGAVGAMGAPAQELPGHPLRSNGNGGQSG